MIRRDFKMQDDADALEPLSPQPTMREAHRIGKTQEELASARCPICREFLVARLGRGGPYFFCGCTTKQAA